MENKVAFYEIDTKNILFLIQKDSVVPFIGKNSVILIKGSADILGFPLVKNKKIRCYSNKERPLLSVCGIHVANLKKITHKFIRNLFIKLKLPKTDIPFTPSAIFILKKYDSESFKKIDPYQAVFIYFDNWRTNINEILENHKILKSPKIMVTGDKNMGKSVFLMHFINSAINKIPEVYCLDTDLGKPLFSLEGSVSLSKIISPILSNIPQSQKLIKSYFINDTSPKDKPMLYLKSIFSLLEYYDSQTQNNTTDKILVINTHGWTSGLGFSLLSQITEQIKANFIVSLENGIIQERSEYENALYEGKLNGLLPNTKIVHIEQKNIKSCLQTSKYKAKNIECVYNFTSNSISKLELIKFDKISFVLPLSKLQYFTKSQLTKYDLLSIFNSQYIALIKNTTKSIIPHKIEDLLISEWNEDTILEIIGVGYISNINYDTGIYLTKLNFIELSGSDFIEIMPLSENIHPRWASDDPAKYIGQPYFYDSYTELNYMPNKRQLK